MYEYSKRKGNFWGRYKSMRTISNVRRLVRLALDEDLPSGDITTDLTVDKGTLCTAKLLAREDLVFCGGPLVAIIIEESGCSVKIDTILPEGSRVTSGTILGELSGSAAELLSLERTVLNFLQRLCGVASWTRGIVDQAGKLRILDTRKTMPGFRYLDKYAVVIGGGRNHRFNLSDMILVKNNHVDVHPSGLRGVLGDIAAKKPMYMSVEVEVRNLAELRVALEHEVNVVMLDNFKDEEISAAVEAVSSSSRRPFIEVSGGINPERLKILTTCGIDGVSMGSLTTRARNVDISLRLSVSP